MSKRRCMISACAATTLGIAFLAGNVANAQQKSLKDQLIGAWTLVSVIVEAADGSKTEGFGPSPKGVIIFASDGNFSLFQSRAEIPKIAANDRARATPEEAAAIISGSIAYYGTYSVGEADKVILVKLAGSTFANLVGGPGQKRVISSLTADELKFTNLRTPSGVTLHTFWKRAKAF